MGWLESKNQQIQKECHCLDGAVSWVPEKNEKRLCLSMRGKGGGGGGGGGEGRSLFDRQG